MIIKGSSRAGPAGLAAHLGNAEANERVEVMESRGTVARDLRGALVEMHALASGTRCQKPLYHAAISPEPPHVLTPEQRTRAVDALEEKLGLMGHARIVVVHEKKDRQHIHVVWSRIDLVRMRSVPDSHNYRRHEECARSLEREFGHSRVQGAHHEREGIERPDRTPSRAELRQEERTGIRAKDVKAEITALFQGSDNAQAFQAALEDAGYLLAKGDSRDFVIIDRAGGTHSLARRIGGLNAAGLREFMSSLDRGALPSASQAEEMQTARHHEDRTPVEAPTVRPGSGEYAEDEERRREALLDDKLEAAYARGDDYVSQSRAALRDFKRGPFLSEEREAEARDEYERGKQEQDQRQRQETQRSQQGEPVASLSSEPDFGGLELTDEKQARLDRLLGDVGSSRDRAPDDPNRQREAPGTGRTRSR